MDSFFKPNKILDDLQTSINAFIESIQLCVILALYESYSKGEIKTREDLYNKMESLTENFFLEMETEYDPNFEQNFFQIYLNSSSGNKEEEVENENHPWLAAGLALKYDIQNRQDFMALAEKWPQPE